MQTSGLAQDFACPSCGYNLRGLLGDPLRCPECGQSTPVPEAFIPSLYLRREYERLGNELATTCGVFIPALGLATAAAWLGWMRQAEIAWSCAFWMVVVFGYWARGVWRFRRSCDAGPGWGVAFLRFQLWMVLQFVAISGVAVLCVWLAPRIVAVAREGGALAWIVVLAVTLMFWVGLFGLLQRGRQWASQSITELQRPTAVARARAAWLHTSAKRRAL